MTPREPDAPAYKDVTLRQLRSFCETARLGSLTSAARELRLAHPTVWKQVHALEEHFGVRLVEPHPRGCRLTDEGRVLAELASPLVADIDRLRQQFGTERTRLGSKLGVASSSRILIEALPEVVADFTKIRPDVQLALRQMEDPRVADAVESGEADLGLADQHATEAIAEWFADEDNARLVEELRALGLRFEADEDDRPVDGPLTGKQYVITGTLESMSREQVREALETLGAKVSDNVSKKTTGVIVGESPGSKVAKAEKAGVPILGEDDLKALLGS